MTSHFALVRNLMGRKIICPSNMSSATIIRCHNLGTEVLESLFEDLQSEMNTMTKREREAEEKKKFVPFGSVYLVNCISRSGKKKTLNFINGGGAAEENRCEFIS